MSLTVDWTRLPVELIEKISESLTIYADYIRFRAVCRTWLTSLPKTPNHIPPQLPWLMVPNAIPDQPCHVFLDLSINKFYFIDHPETSYRKRYCGSSHGWIIIMDETPNVLVVNPLNRAKVPLPRLYTFPNVISFDYNKIGAEYMLLDQFGHVRSHSLEEMRDSFIKKIVLSSNPSKQRDFVAVAILCETGRLAYCRNGGLSPWGIIDDAFFSCEDVIYYRGLFYAVNKYGRVVVCDVNSDSPKVSMVDIQRPQNMRGDILYLIGSGDGLTVICRYLEADIENQADGSFLNYRTVRFKLYRLDWGERKWERVRNLGDQVLFVGQNDSMALSASEVSGYMGNCIYYTDDYSERNYEFGGYCDLGIYKLSDGSIEPLASYPRHSWPAPLWVTPNP